MTMKNWSMLICLVSFQNIAPAKSTPPTCIHQRTPLVVTVYPEAQNTAHDDVNLDLQCVFHQSMVMFISNYKDMFIKFRPVFI